MSLGAELVAALHQALTGERLDPAAIDAEAAKRRILKDGCPRCGDRVSFHSKSGWCHRCGWGANWDGSAGPLR